MKSEKGYSSINFTFFNNETVTKERERERKQKKICKQGQRKREIGRDKE